MQVAIEKVAIAEGQKGLAQLFSARHEFPSEWHRFLHPTSDSGDQTFTFDLEEKRFPFMQDMTIQRNKIELFVKVKKDLDKNSLRLSLTPETSATNQPFAELPDLYGLLHAEMPTNDQSVSWTLKAWLEDSTTHKRLEPDAIEDILIVCHYSIKSA